MPGCTGRYAPAEFLETNVRGTFTLLQEARRQLTSLANAQEVSLYSIDATGLNPLDGFDADRPKDSRQLAQAFGIGSIATADGEGGVVDRVEEPDVKVIKVMTRIKTDDDE